MGALDGKVTLITGAAFGIGKATAELLASEGARICVVDLTDDEGHRVADGLGGLFVPADMGDAKAVDNAFETCVAELRSVDIAFLNAGIAIGHAELETLTDDVYERIMRVNVDGVVYGPGPPSARWSEGTAGAIVATSSLAGLIPFPTGPVYALTQRTVVGLIRSIAPTVAPKGITANTVNPGTACPVHATHLVAIEQIVTRLDSDLRAEAVDAGMRLGLVHALLPMSRLNAYPGRVAALRIRHGHVQQPTATAWRERNPWIAFEEGCREVRAFISRVEQGAGTFQPRPGEDMEALIDGTANVVLRTGPAAWAGNEPQFSSRRPVLPGRLDPRSRVRLVLTQLPVRWSVENVSFAYLATSIVQGRAATASLPDGVDLRRAPKERPWPRGNRVCGVLSWPFGRSWHATRAPSSCSTAAAQPVSWPGCWAASEPAFGSTPRCSRSKATR